MADRRLLLIAMSGVRIVDPDLRALGITLPGFIERGEVIASLPSLGLLTIAGATPEGWEIEYVEIDEVDQSELTALAEGKPDLVGVSSLTARVNDAYRVLSVFRERGVPTVIGGLHASVMPDEASLYADCVVVGEGEFVWPDLIADFEQGLIQSRYDAKFSARGLAETPLPRWDLLEVKKYNRFPLQTTRGCPLDCSFCGASRLISDYKRKPIERVRAELELILEIWPNAFIELADDNTFVNKGWGLQLAELFCGYPGVKWFTESDVSLAQDRNLLEKLAGSGCAQVLVGLESVSEESLKQADSGGWKARKRDGYLEVIDRIQAAGISVNGCFAFGFDADDAGVFDRTADWIEASGLSEVQVTVLTPFPGTQLHGEMARAGRLLRDEFWDECTLFDVVFEPAGMTVDELRHGFLGLVSRVYRAEISEQRRQARMSLYRNRRRKL